LEFGEALSSITNKRISTDDLARHMLDLGFTVMNANYSREDSYDVIKEVSLVLLILALHTSHPLVFSHHVPLRSPHECLG
jgi:hypothetical protein